MIDLLIFLLLLFQSYKINDLSILYLFSPLLLIPIILKGRFYFDRNFIFLSLIGLLGFLSINIEQLNIFIIYLFVVFYYFLSINFFINIDKILILLSLSTLVASFYQIYLFIISNGIVFSGLEGDMRVKGITLSPVDNLFLISCGLYLSEGFLFKVLYSLGLLSTLARSLVISFFLLIFSDFKILIIISIILLLFSIFFIGFENDLALLLLSRLDSFSNEGLYSIRLYLFQTSIAEIFSSLKIFLIGKGWGSVNVYIDSQGADFNNLHNVYFSIFYQAGIFALFIYVIILFKIINNVNNNKNYKSIFLLFIILSCFDNLLFSTCSSVVFAILFGQIFNYEKKNSSNCTI